MPGCLHPRRARCASLGLSDHIDCYRYVNARMLSDRAQAVLSVPSLIRALPPRGRLNRAPRANTANPPHTPGPARPPWPTTTSTNADTPGEVPPGIPPPPATPATTGTLGTTTGPAPTRHHHHAKWSKNRIEAATKGVFFDGHPPAPPRPKRSPTLKWALNRAKMGESGRNCPEVRHSCPNWTPHSVTVGV